MQKHSSLQNQIAQVNLFDLIGCDILSLLQFEYVFLSVYQLQSTSWSQAADVSTVEPALWIDGFAGFLLVLVVSTEYLLNKKVERMWMNYIVLVSKFIPFVF